MYVGLALKLKEDNPQAMLFYERISVCRNDQDHPELRRMIQGMGAGIQLTPKPLCDYHLRFWLSELEA